MGLSAAFFMCGFAMPKNSWADEVLVTPNCELSLLTDDHAVPELAALNETHTLLEMVSGDLAKNLAVQHPSIVMNAYQRAKAWVLSEPVSRIPNPLYRAGEVNVFSIFSKGSANANRKRIIGMYPQIQTLVDYIYAGAKGDGSVSKMPLYAGPAGTGKSEFLSILSLIATNLSLNSPDHYLYTYEWTGLEKVPELHYILNYTMIDHKKVYDARPNPMKQSPFGLLPREVQDKVLALARTRVIDLVGVEPAPPRELNPQDEKIKNLLLAHYQRTDPTCAVLTPRKVVEILNKHVTIRRRLLTGSSAFPKLGFQGRDVPYDQIFFKENPFVSTLKGPDDPMSYFLNGTVLAGEGGMVLNDEFYRNVPEYRDMFLDIVEDREVKRGGAPTVKLDALLVAASNDESIDHAIADGKSKAHIDRSRIIPMRWAIHPLEIAATMLLMKGEFIIRQMPLQKDPSNEAVEGEPVAPTPEMVPGNISELFPLPEKTETLLGPDRRFALWISDGPKAPPILIAPHTLLYMAEVVSGTRIKTDVAAAAKQGSFHVINDAVFRNFIDREKVLMGKRTIPPAQRAELHELHYLLKEGDTGISNRDAANAWLTAALAEASRPENGNTLTPQLAQKVFRRLLQEGGITVPGGSVKLRALWTNIDLAVVKSLLLPELEKDINIAINHGLGSVEDTYDQVIGEMMALATDKTAREYEGANQQLRTINFGRLQEIEKLYAETHGRRLEFTQLANFQFYYGNQNKRRNEELFDVINMYISRHMTQVVSHSDILRFMRSKQGSSEVAGRFADMSDVMLHQLGYNQRAFEAALDLVQQNSISTDQLR